MSDEPSRASALVISRSGLGPANSRRNTLRIAESPNTRLVLLCSTDSTRLRAVRSMATSGSRAKASGPSARSPAMARSSTVVSSLSCSPS